METSVIVIFYNRPAYVRRTIDSLRAQTTQDFELIVVDDASTDSTQEKIRECVESFPVPVRCVLNETNKGFTQSLVDAINLASGRYIAIHGAGDESAPGRLAEQANVLRSNPNVCVVGCFYNNRVEHSGLTRPRRPIADKADFNTLLHANVFSHGEVMFRRDVYDDAGGYRPPLRYAQDRDLWLRMIKCGNFFTVKEFLYQRNIIRDGVSYDARKAPTQLKYSILARQCAKLEPTEQMELLSRVSQNGIDSEIRDSNSSFQRELLRMTLRAAVFGDPSTAKQLSTRLIRTSSRYISSAALNLLRYAPFQRAARIALSVSKQA